MISNTPSGLYCKKGDFYIDPIKPVKTAIITHAHADHARWGMSHYIATPDTCKIMKIRLGNTISTQEFPYFHTFKKNSVHITFIPSGHILGSAQILLNDGHSTVIITGDFKLNSDPTVDAFVKTPADLLVMETTFALPIYHWPSSKIIFEKINSFWKENQKKGLHTILYAYSLGKAQRLLAGINNKIGPIAVHGAIHNLNNIYKQANRLHITPPILTKEVINQWTTPGLIIAPPGVIGSSWLKKINDYKEAYVSGWMISKGQLRQRNMNGFVLSDHADWNELNDLVTSVNPKEVWTVHGYTNIFAKYLNEQGINAKALSEIQIERSE